MNAGRLSLVWLTLLVACSGKVRGADLAAAGSADEGGPSAGTAGAQMSAPGSSMDGGPLGGSPGFEDCSLAVSSCSPGVDGSLYSPWSNTLSAIIQGCAAYCGEVTVDVRSGCVVTIQSDQDLGVLSPHSKPDVSACIREQLVGRNWDCQPSDGRVRVYVGSCTTN
ncbi:MAG TPA: hypothetical protein VJV79_14970 [Polyangiaceae bacterium]|nr:hypothetical protein [Polyangiaceae bacterium]